MARGSNRYCCLRLKDKYNKPVIIISLDKDIGKASARSIDGFDIGSAIIAATQEKILIRGGGHNGHGFSIKLKILINLKNLFLRNLKN